jgi:hypothetical protein
MAREADTGRHTARGVEQQGAIIHVLSRKL